MGSAALRMRCCQNDGWSQAVPMSESAVKGGKDMARTVAIGRQDFEMIVGRNSFYVDKTNFIREWWENNDEVTLITRPRRFGKTLAINMVERFFSVKYKEEKSLFEGLNIWEDEEYRQLQGTYPVINLSFASVKGNSYKSAKYEMFHAISELYNKNRFLLEGNFLSEGKKSILRRFRVICPRRMLLFP